MRLSAGSLIHCKTRKVTTNCQCEQNENRVSTRNFGFNFSRRRRTDRHTDRQSVCLSDKLSGIANRRSHMQPFTRFASFFSSRRCSAVIAGIKMASDENGDTAYRLHSPSPSVSGVGMNELAPPEPSERGCWYHPNEYPRGLLYCGNQKCRRWICFQHAEEVQVDKLTGARTDYLQPFNTEKQWMCKACAYPYNTCCTLL